MTNNLHNIDKLFKQAIDGHEEVPPPTNWDKIENELDEQKVSSLRGKLRRLKWPAASAAALMIFAGVYALGVYSGRNYNNNINETATSNKEAPVIVTRPDGSPSALRMPMSKKEESVVSMTGSAVKRNEMVSEQGRKRSDSEETKAEVNSNKYIYKVEHKVAYNLHHTKVAPATYVPEGSAVNDPGVQPYRNDQPGRQSLSENSENLKKGKKQWTEAAPVESTVYDPGMIHADPLIKPFTGFDQIRSATARQQIVPASSVSIHPGSTASNKGFFAIGIYYTPERTSSRLFDDDHRRIGGPRREEIKHKEQYATTYRTSVLAEYTIQSKWTIQSGIEISKSTLKIGPKTIYAQPDNTGNVRYRFDCSSGYSFINTKQGNMPVAGDSAMAIASSNVLKYITIPLAAKYNFTAGRFTISPAAGVSASFLTSNKLYTTIKDRSTNEKRSDDKIQGLRKNYFSTIFGLGLGYAINNRLDLAVTPTARFALSSTTKNYIEQSYTDMLGVAAGLKVRF